MPAAPNTRANACFEPAISDEADIMPTTLECRLLTLGGVNFLGL
jgi:hypothetical protein